MTENPYLKVFAACGYYDLATPEFGMVYTRDHLHLAPEIRDNFTMGFYEGGHMMYAHEPSLAVVVSPKTVTRPLIVREILSFRPEIGCPLDGAVLIDVDFDNLLKRLTGRRTCSLTGKLLNIHFSPKADLDACTRAGGELIQRVDDNEETIGNRLKVYRAQTEPVVEYYRQAGLLHEVDGEGSVDEVYARVTATLRS